MKYRERAEGMLLVFGEGEGARIRELSSTLPLLVYRSLVGIFPGAGL